jgi:hypothetical protein
MKRKKMMATVMITETLMVMVMATAMTTITVIMMPQVIDYYLNYQTLI